MSADEEEHNYHSRAPREAAEQKKTMAVLTVVSSLAGIVFIYLGRRYHTPLLNSAGVFFLFIAVTEILVYRLLVFRVRCEEISGGDDLNIGDESESGGRENSSARAWWNMQSGGLQSGVLTQTAVGIVLAFYAYYSFKAPAVAAAAAAGKEVYGFGVLCVALAFVCLVISRLLSEYSGKDFPEAAGLEHLFKLAIWQLMVSAALFILHGLGVPNLEKTGHSIFLILYLFLAAEIIIRSVAACFAEEKPITDITVQTDYLVVRFLVSGANPISSIATNLEEQFGVNFKSSWAIDFIRRAIGPITFALVLLAWLWSSLVMVTLFEEGIHLRFGRPVTRETLKPGLHIVMPWPVDRVLKVPVTRLNVMTIGYEESKPNASLLWTKSHAAREYSLLVGNGRDLVTVNAELVWKIKNAYDFTFNCQNPDAVLKEVAYRVLLLETIGKDLDGILSDNVKVFVERVKGEIQEAADDSGLGIEVVAFYLKGLHPPIEVARDYQAVVSSKIDKKRMVIEANAYKLQSIPIAESTSVEKVNTALSYKYSRLSDAGGAAAKFTALYSQYRVEPELYMFRSRLETLEGVLGEGRVYIVDDRFIDNKEPITVDFRQFFKKSF